MVVKAILLVEDMVKMINLPAVLIYPMSLTELLVALDTDTPFISIYWYDLFCCILFQLVYNWAFSVNI